MSGKPQIKINKNHGGKEFSNSFRFIGKVKPVRIKNEETDSWEDAPFYQVKKTNSNMDRRVLQFNIETADKNELKVELAGTEKDNVYVYSRTHSKSAPVAWEDRFNKKAYPDETYHLIAQEWDKASEIADWIEEGIWVDVRGKYEFYSFEDEEGKTVQIRKRAIDNVYPLKNGEVIVEGLKDNEAILVHNQASGGLQYGFGKSKDGTAVVKVGYLNPDGGKLYISKVNKDGEESERKEYLYDENIKEYERVTIKNNLDSEIVLYNQGEKEVHTYYRDFKHENFFEVNTFEMQIGIRSTYQDEATKDTTVNAVYLSYGKEASKPHELEMTVYYKEPAEGKGAFADAFSRLNRLDFLKVKGVDNNRSVYELVEVFDTVDDNPFADVGEVEVNYQRLNTGTKKGLEILSYLTGTYQPGLLTEEEITPQSQSKPVDPFASTEISDDDLPF